MLNQIMHAANSELVKCVKHFHLSNDLEIALTAAIKAAACITTELNERSGKIIFDDKEAQKGIVTEFDKLAEQVIRLELTGSTKYSFLGEEEGLMVGIPSSKQWVVDPIDGTTNFAFGYSFCAVSIALKQGDEFILGVVLELRTGDIFFAEKGKGAYKNGKQIKVSSPKRYGNQPVIFINNGYSIQSKERAGIQLSRLASVIGDFRKLGSTAYELVCLAQGATAAFIASGDELWDYAGALVIVKEAGGRITDWTGAPFEFKSSDIIASNGDLTLHDKLIEASKDLLK